MIDPLRPVRPAPPRRLVLVAAVLAGLAVAIALDGGSGAGEPRAGAPALVARAHAQPAPSPATSDGSATKGPASAQDDAAAAAPAPEPAAEDRRIEAEITIDGRGVTVRKGEGSRRTDAHVVVGDHEFESFEQFVEQAPWLAGLVFMATALVFLVPLVVIVLVIWYKVRRTRMMNETMLKLAERGVVPPAQAMEAIAAGRTAEALRDAPPAAPLYEQARQLRRRAAWSDLRKGVLIGGVGLGLTFWSMLDDGSANAFGLILLFVGIGYTLLWYLEERPGRLPQDAAPPPPGGA
ncbi:MAG: hypothetical protein KJ018_06675 [Burkholderiales bacterium]|nr:hypothetical protein [Burkholderiales bacterium]